MAQPEFEIYQTPTGITAVTNPVQRKILRLLAERERQLPELVELTGKSKPTLSSLHLRELLNRELIVQEHHALDARRRVYRLIGQRVGSSDIPVDKLRGLVQAYAKAAPRITMGSVGFLIACLLEADVSSEVVGRTIGVAGRKLGKERPRSQDVSALVSLGSIMESEGLAKTTLVDLKRGRWEGEAIHAHAKPLVFEAFANGLLEGWGLPTRVELEPGTDLTLRVRA